jgi:squalene-hopene/tetraprenyl-beta-curcumene cyclase
MRHLIALAVLSLFTLTLVLGCGGEEPADPPTKLPDVPEPSEKPLAESLQESYDRGLDFLAGKFGDDGLIQLGDKPEAGVTALAIGAFVRRPGGVRAGDRELVDRVLDTLVDLQQDDGGIYQPGGLANYTTCASVLALSAADRDKDVPVIERAVSFLKGLQWDENRKTPPESEHYGGLGYGNHDRPDLSNTQYNLESLRAGGVDADDPVYRKVLKFLERTQNWSETNPGGVTMPDGKTTKPSDDGGAAYRPGESKAGVDELPDGTVVLRSYGSMTYALLKCYLYAGLQKDDPRVQAAFRWIRGNWTWDENPGFRTAEERQQGLYYYYSTAARALALLGEDVVEIDGEKRDWRKELGGKLVGKQREDGSWLNDKTQRWWEAIPELATSHALSALADCVK